MKKRVVIDCDAGIDDALALILAFHSPELEVAAITGVAGNVPVAVVFHNIQRILTLIQPENRPYIATGASHPLNREAVYAHSVHGIDGLGGAQMDIVAGEDRWHKADIPACELIAKLAREEPGKLTLIAIGPLTNSALALENDPQGMSCLKEIIIMGGAIRTGGNITPNAEFNIYVDPEAARRVFQSDLPVTLIPLDITRRVALTPEIMEERIAAINNPFSRFVLQATGFNTSSGEFQGGRNTFYLHDPLAVGFAVFPDLVGTEILSINVETEKGSHYGSTSESHKEEAKDKKKMNVGLQVNAKLFIDLFISRLER